MSKQIKEVLILDDDAQCRLVLSKIMQNMGFRVWEAETVKQALDLVQVRMPHLVIADLMLVNESGFDYLKQHKMIPSLNDVPLIVVSGVRDKQAIFQAISLGVADFVAKPFEAHLLVQKIKKALKDRQFPVVVIEDEKKSEVTLKVQGRIIMANENGFLLEAPLKIAEETRLDISCSLLRELACETAVFQRTSLQARGSEGGQYLNEVAIVGMSPATAARIKKVISQW